MDEHYLALYHDRLNPKKPPEFADRISRFLRPTDLSNAK